MAESQRLFKGNDDELDALEEAHKIIKEARLRQKDKHHCAPIGKANILIYNKQLITETGIFPGNRTFKSES